MEELLEMMNRGQLENNKKEMGRCAIIGCHEFAEQRANSNPKSPHELFILFVCDKHWQQPFQTQFVCLLSIVQNNMNEKAAKQIITMLRHDVFTDSQLGSLKQYLPPLEEEKNPEDMTREELLEKFKTFGSKMQ